MIGIMYTIFTPTMAQLVHCMPPPPLILNAGKKTPETYTLFINDTWYLMQKASIYEGFLELRASYYGSGSRMTEIGVVFYRGANEKPVSEKQIKIMRDNEILYNFTVSPDTFRKYNSDRDNSVNIDNGVTFYLNELYRFEGCPYEISGVKFPIPQ